MMVWDDVIGIGMQRLSEEAITNAARRPPPARACFSCNEISVAATSRLPLETRIAFSGAMEGKSALTFFYLCLLLAADSPGARGQFFRGRRSG